LRHLEAVAFFKAGFTQENTNPTFIINTKVFAKSGLPN